MLSDDNHVLTANKAFVSLSLFNILSYPLSILPDVIMIAVQAGVSLERLSRFLRSNELDPNSVVKDKSIGKTHITNRFALKQDKKDAKLKKHLLMSN